jgi:hypothetical protein
MGQRDEKRVSHCLKTESNKDEENDFTDKKMASHGALLLMVVKTFVHTSFYQNPVVLRRSYLADRPIHGKNFEGFDGGEVTKQLN